MADMTPKADSERLKAFEHYLEAGENGKRVSFRAIAQKMGIHEATIRRWARVDQWNEKLQRSLGYAATAADATANHIKRRLRGALLAGVIELETIALNGDKDSDRVSAVKALAEIAEKMDAVGTNLGAGAGDAAGTLEWSDDIIEAQVPAEAPIEIKES